MHRHVKCFASKLYHIYKEQVQIAGYMVLMATVLSGLYMGFDFIRTARANTVSITINSADIENLKQWKNDTNVSLGAMKQEVHDIHDYLLPNKK